MRKNTVVLQYEKCGTKKGMNCTTADGICRHTDIKSTCRHPSYLNRRGFETDIREVPSEWYIRPVEKDEVGEEEETAINAAQEEEAMTEEIE
jgi:hypothetical protein